ncbi:triose-phosphate transporter family-domain-containing protein [Usnea florida]
MALSKEPHSHSIKTERELESAKSTSTSTSSQPNPKSDTHSGGLHPAFYIAIWIALSSSIILFNKWILSTLLLTTWHLVFATIMTQLMARMTTVLDSRRKVPMNTGIYLQAIVPIGLMFSMSLICGNLAYLYLSVSFIQMLKATNSVATLLVTWGFGIAPPDLRTLANVSLIVIGVVIASCGEIKFDLRGFIYQVGGILFEALRLVMVQRLLSSADFKMDPLVSLYYFAPACATINGLFTLFMELPRLTMQDIYGVGFLTLFANAFVAFLLNVSVVLLIDKTSAVVLTLSGVLKDIFLVVASILIFHDPVTRLQYFGYSIALAGLMYYKLGGNKFQQAVKEVQLSLADLHRTNPARTKATILCSALGALALFVWVWWPTMPEIYKTAPFH